MDGKFAVEEVVIAGSLVVALAVHTVTAAGIAKVIIIIVVVVVVIVVEYVIIWSTKNLYLFIC